MNTATKIFAAFLINMAATGIAFAGGTKEEAMAMLNKAVEMAQKQGADATLKAITDPDNKTFHDRDLYIFAYDMEGICIGHGGNPKLVGKNLKDMKDANGKAWFPDAYAVIKAKGEGTTEFMWNNPETHKVQPKIAFLKKIPGREAFFGTGVYK